MMQDLGSRLAADQRVRALYGPALWLIVLLGAAMTALAAFTILQTAFVMTANPATLAINVDFRVFWAAGRLALEGEPLAAFDMARLGAVHNVMPDAWMPWLYPPGYLLALMPFGALPFAQSFLVATLLSILLVGLAVRPFVAGSVPVWLGLTLAPAYVPALILGQNSLFWLAGFLAALAALQKGRWVLAGLCIGCLTLKPQLGLLIPVALLAAGLWRTILAATVTTAVLALGPSFVFGFGYWPLLAKRLGEQSASMVVSLPDLFLMVGPCYLLTLMGTSVDTALAVQWGIIALSVGFVAVLWRSRRIDFDAKVAGLMLAMLLSAPYLWYYEVAMMAAIGLFMVRGGMIGRSFPRLLLLAFLWCGGLLQALNAFFDFADGRMIGAVIITPVLVASLIIVLIHAFAATPRGQLVTA
jgi:arabinofuranan 3-O-arabinosyltransferase